MIDPRGARVMTRKAIHDGLLTRQPCTKCGAEKTEAHHEDYSRQLDVVWLCQRCHGARHREINREAGSNNEFRTTLNLPADMTRLIDNYWHSEQLRSRNEAIRELLRKALGAVDERLVERIKQETPEQRERRLEKMRARFAKEDSEGRR